MEGLLAPVSQTYRKSAEDELFKISKPPDEAVKVQPLSFSGDSATEALDVLKSQPGYDTLVKVLRYLYQGTKGNHSFNIRAPSPLGAQIVHVVVTEIIPNYWTVLKEGSKSQSKQRDIDVLLACLLSLTGVNAISVFLKVLVREARNNPKDLKNSHVIFNLGFTLELLNRLLKSDGQVKRLWEGVTSAVSESAKIRPLQQEFISLFGGGKLVSLTAEADDILHQADKPDNSTWISDGKQYIGWLGQNIIDWVKSTRSEDEFKLIAGLLTRSLRLPHSESLTKLLFTELLVQGKPDDTKFAELVNIVPQTDQKKIILGILKLLPGSYLNSIPDEMTTEHYPLIWGTAGAVNKLVAGSPTRKGYLIDWLTSNSGAGLGDGCGIRRAALAVLADDKEAMTTVLEKSMSQFGDQLYIQHAPVLQQEAHAQVLLLAAGYVHRMSPIKLTLLLRSSAYLNAISNRLSAPQTKAKFLGMVVGEALSGLVHGSEKKLDFHVDETNTEEAKWYKSLVQVFDKVGPIDALRIQERPEGQQPKQIKPSQKAQVKVAQPIPKLPKQSGFIIEEIEDDEEDDGEDDDLVPYAKPDSDEEDSDDDPTLINRDKPKAPVYIRDLITYLRDTENYDRQKLGLTTAPVLIRRKANHGTEVSSHAEELATLLLGLEDKYDLENFNDLRLQGMVAIVLALPKKMGQWFAKTFFDGDFSLSQRAAILITLGLSGRELAGFETSEYAASTAFPSKTLPAKVEKYYSTPSPSTNRLGSSSNLKALPLTALDTAAQSLSQTFLAPMAAEAADATTGPDALKLSSFTSRLQQAQKQGKALSRPRTRNIPNTTASLLASSFFFPLASRFQAAVRAASSGTRGILFQPHLLALYLKTLALLLHAAGPSTLALPQLTSELWDLLLSVRGQCAGGELGVTQAVLFGFVALLDVNENDMRGLCERHGREVVETMEWAGGVFERTRGGDTGGGDGGGGQENEVKMMAAGVLIRLREAVDKYRALMMGDLIGLSQS